MSLDISEPAGDMPDPILRYHAALAECDAADLAEWEKLASEPPPTLDEQLRNICSFAVCEATAWLTWHEDRADERKIIATYGRLPDQVAAFDELDNALHDGADSEELEALERQCYAKLYRMQERARGMQLVARYAQNDPVHITRSLQADELLHSAAISWLELYTSLAATRRQAARQPDEAAALYELALQKLAFSAPLSVRNAPAW